MADYIHNAFQAVRPRGPDLDIPARPPKKVASGLPLSVKALDRRGRQTVGIEPRAMGRSKAGQK